MRRKRHRRSRGQTLIETLVGFIVLIPIGLFSVNVVALVTTSQGNEQLAEAAARAASTQHTALKATDAAKETLVNILQESHIVQSATVESVDYNVAAGQVTVTTLMSVKLPVPIPGFSETVCRASSVQPIVSTPAPI